MLENQKRLLVIDNEAVVAEFIARVLSKQGFVVDVAANGEAAKGLLGINDYEVVILDIHLPKMDGRQLYEYIKTAHPLLQNRVVFISRELPDDGTASFLASENRLFLNKPFGSEDLKAKVEQTLQLLSGISSG